MSSVASSHADDSEPEPDVSSATPLPPPSCCTMPQQRQTKLELSTLPVGGVFHIKGGTGGVHIGGVHIHLGDASVQATEWDAVPISAEAKALLQEHAVKASAALKMHDVLGFEDAADLQCLSPDLVSRLDLKPLQLQPLLRLLLDRQLHQDIPAPKAGASPAPIVPRSGPFPASGQQEDSSNAATASGAVPPAAPAASAGAVAPLGAGTRPRRKDGLHRHPCIAVLQGKPGTVKCIAITPDGRRALTAGPGRQLQVWDLEARACVGTLEGHGARVTAVVISLDGRQAVSSSIDGTLRVWDLGTCACTASMDADRCSRAVAITPDGRHALYGDGALLFKWAMDDSKAWEVDRDSEDIECIVITPDGRRAVTNGAYNKLLLWDLEECTLVGTLTGGGESVSALAITPDGRLAVSASKYSEALSVWDLSSRTCTGTLKGHEGNVTCVAISPDGRRAVSSSQDRTLRVWDLATLTCTGIMDEPSTWVECVAITPDGRCAVSGGKDLRVWDLSAPAPGCAGCTGGEAPAGSPPGELCGAVVVLLVCAGVLLSLLLLLLLCDW